MLLYDQINRGPYLGRRVPEVDKYNTQVDRHDISQPQSATEETSDKLDKGKQPEYQTDYDSDSTGQKPVKEHHSKDDELNKETSFDTSIIQNSLIGIQPTLLPTILTSIAMSTATLTQPTITVQATNVAPTSGMATTTRDPTQQIKNAINKALQRNLGSGPGGPEAPGGPVGQPANQ